MLYVKAPLPPLCLQILQPCYFVQDMTQHYSNLLKENWNHRIIRRECWDTLLLVLTMLREKTKERCYRHMVDGKQQPINMCGEVAWQHVQTISRELLTFTAEHLSKRCVAIATPPPRLSSKWFLQKISKSERSWRISQSSMLEVSHVSVNRMTLLEEEEIKVHNGSRFGIKLQMLV